MTRRSRRTVLSGTAGIFVLAADYFGDRIFDGETDEESDHGSEESPTVVESVDDVPITDTAGPESGPDGKLFCDADDVLEWLTRYDRDDEEYTEFVDVTDFETSVIVALEADAPTPCHELSLEESAFEQRDESEEPSLELEAAVREEEGDETVCPQVESVVGRLIRAPIADEPSVSVTIVDRHGENHDFRFGDGDESDSNDAD
ncbi:hypothetical protein RBH26_00645 [Natronolimnohabitans sp. A-GB9]|uniref:hypothetical protein n=1 Tax=Natronolimnohabitans sp. A-GB9 TaxID=3069757 RepID=UPI0027B624B1|nr:hypothetical protein [Natronolimnohabitans sp. A-GB9]MDQ2048984.1 hypothetical protein [Natronolimnohabitans sp. A-GB9]